MRHTFFLSPLYLFLSLIVGIIFSQRCCSVQCYNEVVSFLRKIDISLMTLGYRTTRLLEVKSSMSEAALRDRSALKQNSNSSNTTNSQ